ncbi:hypothetical protein B5807_09158 [Epicoccum nigrum]|uniref:Uncharacterized protein n=1 Tax=Epicoccum nigrum TaxID=105696 RepID=A0A1Y2LLY9_EPING|nr:hypothetical protein B5807_09158 [Epicoccum nigrum]
MSQAHGSVECRMGLDARVLSAQSVRRELSHRLTSQQVLSCRTLRRLKVGHDLRTVHCQGKRKCVGRAVRLHGFYVVLDFQ